jgi:hypothetical protein
MFLLPSVLAHININFTVSREKNINSLKTNVMKCFLVGGLCQPFLPCDIKTVYKLSQCTFTDAANLVLQIDTNVFSVRCSKS